jgi:small subunit ribosomal protein S14
MAKQSMIQRELKRKNLAAKYAEKRKKVLSSLKNSNTYQEKLILFGEIQALPRNSAPSRRRNRCWATGRSRSFYRNFGLSRHVLREMAHEGNIPGIKKSSW